MFVLDHPNVKLHYAVHGAERILWLLDKCTYFFYLSILFDKEKCTTHKPIFSYNRKYFILLNVILHFLHRLLLQSESLVYGTNTRYTNTALCNGDQII